MNIKKNDTVIVLSGKSKGKKGKVIAAMPKENKVQLYCSKCGKGVRVGFNVDGDKKVRVCKKCGKEI